MLTSSTRICTSVLRFTVLLCFWLQAHHNVFAANVTVSDTDPSIVYSPVESWFPSSNLCSTCLDPGISMSYHEGINSAPGPGPTVVSTSSTSIPSTSIPSTSIPSTSIPSTSIPSTSTPTTPSLPPQSAPISSPILVVTSKGGSTPTVSSSPSSPSPTAEDSGDHRGRHGKDGRALARQLLNSSGSVDTPVTLSYNFTGTAIYLFSIQPPTEAPVGGTPTNTNLSFTLDNQPAGNFSPTETSTEFLPNTNVLSLHGLSNQPHQLVVTVGDDSVFLFDYLIYTNSAKSGKKKNNVATFGGALGGSVGVLSLFSLGIAISIIRRRILAARRDRLDNEANGTSDTPSMSGPMPFVPRYFPDTIIPRDPPTYIDALSSTNHNNTPSILASLASSVNSLRQRSYADIPPNSPPPQMEEFPPPPFPVALSAPVLNLPAGATVPSISAANQTDLGRDSSNVVSPHEDTPLLQSSDSDTSPHSESRTSTPSPELSENSETNLHHQEDAS